MLISRPTDMVESQFIIHYIEVIMKISQVAFSIVNSLPLAKISKFSNLDERGCRLTAYRN